MIASRLVAYQPNGARIGVLPDPVSWSGHMPVNGVSALTLSYFGTSTGSAALADPVEVALEVSNGGPWAEPANARFLRLVRDRDQVDKSDLWRFSMPGYGFLLKYACVLPAKTPSAANTDEQGKRKFLSATAGTILKTVIDEARALDPRVLEGLTIDFTTSKDSAGAAWSKIITIYYEPGMGLDSIIENLAAQGVLDWQLQGRTLQAFNPDAALARKRPQIRIHDQDTEQGPIKGTLEGLKHLVLLKGDEGKLWTKENVSAPTPWGKSIAFINQGGVRDEGTASTLIQAELDAGSRERVQYTRALTLTEHTPVPFVDYRPGDFITAKGAGNTWESLRVFALGLGRDQGVHKVTLTLGDLFEDAMIRQAKRTKGIVGGATSDGGSGARPAPPEPGKRKPAAPAGLVMNSDHYFDSKGVAHATVIAAYAPATAGTDGLALTITRHELLGRKAGTADTFRVITSVPGSEGTIGFAPLPVDELWQFKVRAIAENGIASDFSNQVDLHLAKDTTPPPVPSKPGVATRTGIISVQWDYLTHLGTDMPLDFDYVDVEVTNHGDSGFVSAGKITMNGGSLPLSTLPFDVVTQIRFVAVDTSGNRSVASEITEVTAQKLVDTDLSGTTIFPALDAVEADAAAAAAAAAAAKADALAAAGAASNAQSTATAAGTAASNAAGAASAANSAALAAAGIANSKGEVIYQLSAPTGSRANSANLWIRTTDNKPHTYNGTTWVATTDKAATDAAAAAVTAQNAANSAATAASNAQSTATAAGTAASNAQSAANAAAAAAAAAQAKADSAAAAATTAQNTADGKNRLIRSSANPSGTGFKAGDQWWKYVGTRLNGYWIHDGTNWAAQVLDGAILAYIDAGTITVGFLSGERLQARSVDATKLTIGDFENYWNDPDFLIAEPYGAIWDIVNGGIERNGTGVQGGRYIATSWFPVQAGDRFKVSAKRTNIQGGTGNASIYFQHRSATGAVFYGGRPLYLNAEGEIVGPPYSVPAGVVALQVGFYTEADMPSTTRVRIENVVIRRMVAGELVVDGTIRAQHVKTNELTVQHFVAGALQAEVINVMSSDHAPGVPAVRINGQGIRTYDREGGEAVSITGLGNDFLTISKSNGDTVATLDSTGGASFESLAVAGEARVDGVLIIGGDPVAGHGSGNYGPVVHGRDLLGKTFKDYVEDHPNISDGNAWLTGMPHGQVVNAWRQEGTAALVVNALSQETHMMRLQTTFEFTSGRIYEISYRTPAFRAVEARSNTANGWAAVVRYTTGNTALAATGGSILVGSRLYAPAAGNAYTARASTTLRCPEDIPAGRVTLGIAVYAYSGRKIESITTADQHRWEIAIRDGGMRRTANQGRSVNLTATSGSATTPPAPPAPEKKQYTTTWNESWGQTYRAAGTQNGGMNGKIAQGRSPYASSEGVMRGLVGFPSVTGTLSGADIVKVEVYVYAAHWHSNAGGTLCIGGHTHASKPTTWSSNLNDAKRQKLKKPEGRWITLPASMHAGFKSGLYKGISLLPPGSSTSTEYYGYLTAGKQKLRITYKK